MLSYSAPCASRNNGTRAVEYSVAAGVLQKAGLIRYTRGRITVVDRIGLQNAACECYGIMVQEYQRLMGFSQN